METLKYFLDCTSLLMVHWPFVFQLVSTSAVWTWQKTLPTSSAIPSRTWRRWRWGRSLCCSAGRASSVRGARRTGSTSSAATSWTSVSSARSSSAWTTSCSLLLALSAGCHEHLPRRSLAVAIATRLEIQRRKTHLRSQFSLCLIMWILNVTLKYFPPVSCASHTESSLYYFQIVHIQLF